MWALTVATLMYSSPATSAFVPPCATATTTSRSRGPLYAPDVHAYAPLKRHGDHPAGRAARGNRWSTGRIGAPRPSGPGPTLILHPSMTRCPCTKVTRTLGFRCKRSGEAADASPLTSGLFRVFHG